jgi:hypothetical protein
VSSESQRGPASTALQRAEDIYASLPPLRALVAAIPFVGGSLDALFGGYAGKLQERRVRQLFDELRTMMGKLDEAKLDASFIESDEWADLVLKALRSATQSGNEKKIRLYAAIMAASAVSGGVRDPEPESLLSALAELSPAQVEVLSMLHRESSRRGYLTFLVEAREKWGGDLEFHLSRIAATGFIVGQGAFGDVVGGSNYQGAHYVTTPTFRRLLDLLRDVYGDAFD